MTPPGAAPASLRDDRDRRKRSGVFYTPEPVARYMATSTLQTLPQSASADPIRVLDPACGDGALLWPAYQFLCQQQGRSQPAERLHVLRHQLFGVELDSTALQRLRQRFRDDLATSVSPSELDEVLEANFRCGNAVHGHGWDSPESNALARGARVPRATQKLAGRSAGRAPLISADRDFEEPLFHWSQQFPAVGLGGGFDVIIANPPYRRERGAKSDLQNLQQSPLALSRHQARMDLWHYFFHRSLDLLRPGGLFTLIVNSYWTTSQAGQPLIDRMAAETTPLEFVLLDTAPVFAGVDGRHLIARMRKGITSEPCRIVRLSGEQRASVLDRTLWQGLSADHSATYASPTTLAPVTCRTSSRDSVFAGGRLNLDQRESSRPVMQTRHCVCLGDLFEVRQGIAENPPKVTRQQAQADPNLRAGEGVFVLSSNELARLELNAVERESVRPYYTAADITKSRQLPLGQWLLYLTRQTAPDLTALPQIQQHLSRFRTLLEERREVRQGKIAWWHLHWPREQRLFESPRILAVQMAREPRFAYVERPAYVGFSVNLIVDRIASPESGQSYDLSLEALETILNSKFAAHWFDAHAKRRGVNLDITGSTLKRFPLPPVERSTCAQLVELARQRHQSAMPTIDDQINQLVDALFAT